jgi:Holliday junction resolvase RusA-like endonuclease
MTPRPLVFLDVRVAGVPVPQGSASAFAVKTRSGAVRAVVTDQKRKTLKPWREAVRSTVVDVLPDDWSPEDGPVHVELRFALAKPASAPKRRRTWPIGARSGDIDKLTRGVLDALTDAGLWKDDSQVISLDVRKDYAGHDDVEQRSPGVVIRVHRADVTTALAHLSDSLI